MDDKYYQNIIDNIDKLPSMPTVASRLITLVNSPDSSAEDVAQLIGTDPALTTKMLRLANSAFYGMPRSISSVSGAVVVLGFNTIRSVVLSAVIMKMFPKSDNDNLFEMERFWIHSINTALIAKLIAKSFFSTMLIDPESCFCAGIIHDVGKLIFNQVVPDDFYRACSLSKRKNISLLEAESNILGINHAEIGHLLADKWGLPIDLESALVHHHKPEDSGQIEVLVSVVHIADIIAHSVGFNIWDNESIPELSDVAMDKLSLTNEDIESFKEDAKTNMEKSSDFFSMINEN